MSRYRIDIVTVFHNEKNFAQSLELSRSVTKHETDGGYRLIGVDNRRKNRGFAQACNLGAFHPTADAPIIGFLNPDLVVAGPFIDLVEQTLVRPVVITGHRFDKPQRELDLWGLRNWVCGAALFVERTWFLSVGGFDPQFVWSFEESDLIRQAEMTGLACKALPLPFEHRSPDEDTLEDAAYKRLHFAQAHDRYYRKWGT